MKKAKATLIKKETLSSNFKLTFRNQAEKEYFLILHKSKNEIYNKLEINQDYFHTWKKKGNKNYSFIIPQSIRKIEKAAKRQANQQPNYQKDFFTQQLIKDLRLKDLTEKEFFDKIESLKTKLGQLKFAFVLDWTQKYITTLFLKHKKLEQEQHDYTEQEQREKDFLTKIGTMFLYDWIYYQDKRKNKYNQYYHSKVPKS